MRLMLKITEQLPRQGKLLHNSITTSLAHCVKEQNLIKVENECITGQEYIIFLYIKRRILFNNTNNIISSTALDCTLRWRIYCDLLKK